MVDLFLDTVANTGSEPVPDDAEAASVSRTGRRDFAFSSPDIALSLRGICLSFGGVRALVDVDLDVCEGEIRALIGPNGAGKSSLINVISGLYHPNAGQIIVDGVPFRRVPTNQIASLGISRTFQSLALFEGLSVRDNIACGLVHGRHATFVEHIMGLPRARSEDREVNAKVNAVVEFLHLEAQVDDLVSTLSYGLQKRVDLGRALVSSPKILLLDEPMAGMTAIEKTEMAGLIRAARDKEGFCVILVEHDIGVVMGLSDYVSVLDYGHKIADGTPSDVSSDPEVIRAYIGAAEDDG